MYLKSILVLKLKLKSVRLNDDQNYGTKPFWITVRICCLQYLKLGYEKLNKNIILKNIS